MQLKSLKNIENSVYNSNPVINYDSNGKQAKLLSFDGCKLASTVNLVALKYKALEKKFIEEYEELFNSRSTNRERIQLKSQVKTTLQKLKDCFFYFEEPHYREWRYNSECYYTYSPSGVPDDLLLIDKRLLSRKYTDMQYHLVSVLIDFVEAYKGEDLQTFPVQNKKNVIATKSAVFGGFQMQRGYNAETLKQLHSAFNKHGFIDDDTSHSDFIAVFTDKEAAKNEKYIHITNTTSFVAIIDKVLKVCFRKLKDSDIESSGAFRKDGKIITANNIQAQRSKTKEKPSHSKDEVDAMISSDLNFLQKK